MSVRVRIPTPLRPVVDNQAEVSLDATTVEEVLAQLEAQFPSAQGRLRDEQGAVRRFLNLYVNGEDVRFLDGLNTGLKSGDELSIISAVAGG
jgi:molybdopterin synthase sulfur carrier subunit